MATQLSDVTIHELSVVFGELDGKHFAPRNEEARVLSIKGGEKKTKKLQKALDTIKAFLTGEKPQADLVVDICKAAVGIGQALNLEEPQRSETIAALVAPFQVQKAGARHSAADKAHIDALQAAHAKAKKAVDSMGDHLAALQPDADKAAPKPYGDVTYADPKNGKYPIDTEEHARAAWSYINQEKNAAEYSADELAEVKARIKAACEKFGIDISKAAEVDSAITESTEEVEMTAEEVQALIAKALEAKDAEHAAALEAAKAEAETAKAEAEAAKAAAESAKAEEARKAAEAEEARKAAEAEAQRLQDEATAQARKASAASGAPKITGVSERLQAAVKAALRDSITPVI